MSGYYIEMIDVGAGDAFVVQDCESNEFALIDVGAPHSADIVWDRLAQDYSSRPEALILTHVDADHIGATTKLLDKGLAPKAVFFNDPQKAFSDYQSKKKQGSYQVKLAEMTITASVNQGNQLLSALQQKHISVKPATKGLLISVGKYVTIKVLSPSWSEFVDAIPYFTENNRTQLFNETKTASVRSNSAENESSVVLEVYFNGELDALFTADAGVDTLSRITQGKQYPWVKVPHHGSWHACSEDLVKQWRPTRGDWVAAFSRSLRLSGDKNLEVDKWFQNNGARILCTACHGSVLFRHRGAPPREHWSPIEPGCVNEHS